MCILAKGGVHLLPVGCAFSPPGCADYGERCAFPAKGVCNS